MIANSKLPHGNLPRRPTRFIGHGDEVVHLAGALESHSVITITGPGGVGKTRTAIELAQRMATLYPDGVWFVNLALLDDDADVVPFVCETLRDVAPLAREAKSFAAAMRERKVLLVFDSCEHVLPQTAALVKAIVEVAPQCRAIVTSREPLQMESEFVHRLQSLEPDDAVELFVERARSAGVKMEYDRRAIAHAIVERLDAIPLAIELAAPQLRTMSGEELLRSLDDRLQLLAMENRRATSRQQTLEAMLDWSHRLLTDDAQKLFRRLAIFVGGCTLEAAMHVCADETFNEARLSEALDELVAKSLVIAEPVGGRTRYRMLEITRAYSQGMLFASQEYDDAAQSHVHFFCVLASRLERMLEAQPVVEWQNLVTIDAQNFRAALSLALDAGDVESSAAICESLHYWLWEHGSAHASDLTSRIATILATTMESAVEAPLRLTYAGLLRRTDRPRALDAAKRAYELYRAKGDAMHIADALRCMGSLQHDVLGAPAAKMAGDMERYADLMLEQGSTLRSAELLNNLGVSYAQMLDDARLQDALLCFERAAGLLEARGDRERAGRVIGNSAATAYLLGDVELAAHWAGRAVTFFDREIDAMGAGHQWSNYGFYLCMVGRYDEAKAALERGLEIAKSIGDRLGVAGVFEYASHYYHLTGNDPFAAQLIGASEVLMPADVAAQARAAAVMQELIASLKASLGEEAYEEHRKRGLAMPLDEVMREACLP